MAGTGRSTTTTIVIIATTIATTGAERAELDIGARG